VSLIENDVLASLEMMLTASGQTMLCPADTNTKNKSKSFDLLLFFGTDTQNGTGPKPLILPGWGPDFFF